MIVASAAAPAGGTPIHHGNALSAGSKPRNSPNAAAMINSCASTKLPGIIVVIPIGNEVRKAAAVTPARIYVHVAWKQVSHMRRAPRGQWSLTISSQRRNS